MKSLDIRRSTENVSRYAGGVRRLHAFRKAGLMMAAAQKNCELYKATVAGTQEVQYAL